ncbi:MAG: ABC-three component system protein [Alphaproteobacteria bacterium]
MTVTDIVKPKSSVPGQYLGYGLQPIRLCYHLLSVPVRYKVSLEHLDDIAIHAPDGKFILEQTKSALSGNPAANRSAELWKTLANWADLCVANTVEANRTCFRYYVVPLKEGELVSELHNANNTDQSNELLNKFRTESFIGKKGAGIEPHIMQFLAAGEEICLQIIQNFEFVSEVDPIEPIRSKLIALFSDDTLDQFCAAAIGLAKDQVEKQIRAKQLPVLDAGSFRKTFRAFIKKYDFSNLLIPTIEEPAPHEIHGVIRSLPVFVRQLNAIEASENLVNVAVSDFLRSAADKTHWAADGDILEGSLDEMDSSLLRHYALTRDEIVDTNARLQPEAKGRKIYRMCTDLQMPLEGRALPAYFIAGEYNYLADDLRLGWHADYKNIFSSD